MRLGRWLPLVRGLSMPDIDRARQEVHEAIGHYLEDDEIAVSWVVTVDVAGADGSRYLAHRAGGGADGQDHPMAWTALGMLTASADLARQQLIGDTRDADDE